MYFVTYVEFLGVLTNKSDTAVLIFEKLFPNIYRKDFCQDEDYLLFRPIFHREGRF